MSTIFQKIIDREIPAKIVYEDEQCLAFHDVNPQAPVHVLLIPKTPIVAMGSVKSEDATVLGHLMTVVPVLADQLGLTNFRLVTNSGAEAGQSVFHLHFHLLGGRPMKWPPG